jgi:DHA2 family multidrug resistance protein
MPTDNMPRSSINPRTRAFITVSVMLATIMLVLDTTIAHASLVGHINVFNPLAQPDTLPGIWNFQSPAGLAALNAEVTRQASMIAYVDDFRLLFVLALAVMPLLILLGSALVGPGTPAAPEH